MYPYEIVFGLTAYDILLGLAALTAVFIFARFSNKRKLDAKYHNFILTDAVVTVILGYGFSVLFQAVYNWLGGDNFEIAENTGATFLGGLLGGAAVFLGFYYGAGHFVFKDGYHKKIMYDILEVFSICVPAAHAVGRIGCLFAGCCYGAKTEAWYGITMAYLGYKVIPVQLFEAIFLALLAAVLWIRAEMEKHGNLPLYMLCYGIWRFLIEYLRDDDRGSTVVSFLSPSQLISLLLIAGAAVLWFVLYRKPAAKVKNDG